MRYRIREDTYHNGKKTYTIEEGCTFKKYWFFGETVEYWEDYEEYHLEGFYDHHSTVSFDNKTEAIKFLETLKNDVNNVCPERVEYIY